MTENSVQSNKRIAKNTLIMYFRMLITMAVGLYASRVVLATLGASDYGLYNVVGGIVVVLASINGTLAIGTQRFISFAIGKKDDNKLKAVFSTAIFLHLLFAILFLLIAETLGLWFLNEKMNIPEGRETAAIWVYQFSILATVISIVQVPYMSAIIAHEKMGVYAYMSIYDAVAKLLIVFLIQIASYDKLIFYAALICAVAATSALIYNLYCRKKFIECRLKPRMNKITFKEMASFTGWNLIGCFAFPLQTQGLNILFNMFFGTIVNAARGIAVHVNTMLLQFVNSFQTAVNPQIVKLYASGEKEAMVRLVITNCNLAGFLFLLLAVPLFVEIEFVLDVWLGEYPEYTVNFIKIALVQSLIETLHRPVATSVHAVGKMKMPNLTAGIALALSIPFSFYLLKNGASPELVLIVNLIPWLLSTFFDLICEKYYINFPVFQYYKKVYLIVIPAALVLVTASTVIRSLIPFEGFLRFMIVAVFSASTTGLATLYLGMNKTYRKKVYKYIGTKVFFSKHKKI